MACQPFTGSFLFPLFFVALPRFPPLYDVISEPLLFETSALLKCDHQDSPVGVISASSGIPGRLHRIAW